VPLGHNRYRPKIGGLCHVWGRGELGPNLTQCCLGRGLYLRTKWHLDTSSHLVTTDIGRKLGVVPYWDGEQGLHLTQCDQQAGQNKGASQSGMSMGGVRHVADIRADDMSKEGHGVIGLQAGSNLGASQAGMSMGGVRHAADIQAGPMDASSAGIISLQYGSTAGATQEGMSMGGRRDVK